MEQIADYFKNSQDVGKLTKLMERFKTIDELEAFVNKNTSPPPEPDNPNINSSAPIVQMYEPNDLTKVFKIYPSVTEATRSITNASYTGIKLANRYKTVYLGYRWNLLNRQDPIDPAKARDIGPTKEKEERKTGSVAKMSPDLKKVVEVFALQKDAADSIGQKCSVICTAIKFGNIANGHRWMLFENVEQAIADEWLADNAMPERPANVRSTRVQQIDATTGQVLHIYDSQADVLTKYKMSTKTLKAYAGSDKQYKGFKWALLD